ncbi:unnamed protein product [Symbiodinium natans]|uniref:Uncharacterized protein n=1 Tax=Symbiodinium natans TaxID=878477 RepID=A0A812I5A7_9DINO|nr:unnamed protein product [Symbiodinium natans]
MPKRTLEGDAVVQDDVQSGCDEGNWFQAEKHRSEIRSFLRGPGNSERFAMIDLFGASGQMSKRWRKAGWDAFAYDIKTSKAHDVTSADGFWALCSAGKRLMTNGLIFGGPPCSLYVWISKSVHKRSEDNAFVGDTGLYKVRMSNRIVANMCVFLQELSECKDFYTVIEQPSSSAMFKMKVTSSLAKQLEMERVWTWMGLFGHELPKATILTGNLPSLPTLRRVLTNASRKQIKNRQKKTGGAKFYTRDADGKVTGNKSLQNTAAYTAEFCTAVYKAWAKDLKAN